MHVNSVSGVADSWQAGSNVESELAAGDNTALLQQVSAMHHLATSIGLVGSALTDMVELMRRYLASTTTMTQHAEVTTSVSAASQWSSEPGARDSVADVIGDALTYVSL